MSVIETDVNAHSEAVETLFRQYHEWTRQMVIETHGGDEVPIDEIEQTYDIDTLVAEDIAYLTDPDTESRFFTARDGGKIVGCVILQWRSENTAEVKRLYVQPEARGGGLGRSLMEALIEAARDDGCTTLLLFTNPFSNDAQSLYKDLGFEYTSPFDCEAPEEVYDDLVFMRLELET